MYEYPLPDQLNGEGLAYEIRQATGRRLVNVHVADDILYIETHAPEEDIAPIVAAHTGTPTPEVQAERESQAEDDQRRDQFDKLRDKARAVWRGNDTFTQAQAQRILAGLVLLELRRRR